MNTLNQQISEYTALLQQGEIQQAYRGILEFMGKLRANFIKQYPQYEISGLYQGYMDMSYFSIFTKSLKEKGLKIALVYWHEKNQFEVWLSARNRVLTRQYEAVLHETPLQGIPTFHDVTNLDAIVENVLAVTPDFEEPDTLVSTLEQGTKRFMEAISKLFHDLP